jgi:chaperone BCS1
MLQLIKNIVSGHNEFASGGLLLMLIGGLGVYLRAVPEAIWEWLLSQTTMMITVADDDAAFVWVKEWFLEQNFVKRIRRVDLDTTLRAERIALIPAPGHHWFWYGGRVFEVWFYRSEEARERTARRVESLTFRTLGRKQALLRQLVDEIVRCHMARMGVRSYLYTYSDGWDLVEAYAPRLLESVVLPAGEKEQIVADIEKFRSSKQRYACLGVPYHRGYLFHGPPGTGKTSLVSALATHFGLSVYCVNLTDLNDRTLMSAVNQVPANSLLLFEDIDCMKSGNARPSSITNGGKGSEVPEKKGNAAERNGVTLSGLLNVLDGFYAPSGVLFVMTTNQVEALDPAVLRPGRIDYKLYLGKAGDRQKIELCLRFFPEASEAEAIAFVEFHRAVETMAEFQGLLLATEIDRLKFELVSAN